jgi:hypothetical protein
MAGYGVNQKDEKGAVTFEAFKNTLNSFPWTEQLQKYNEIKEGASATISVINDANETILWVSIAGTEDKKSFLIGYVFSKSIKGFLGLGKSKIRRWVDIYSVRTLNEVIPLFDLYFSGKNEELLSTLFLEEKFDSMAVPE